MHRWLDAAQHPVNEPPAPTAISQTAFQTGVTSKPHQQPTKTSGGGAHGPVKGEQRRTGGIGPDQHAIHQLQEGRISGHPRVNRCAGGGLTACGGGGSDDTIRALVATDQSLSTAFNTPVVVNLLANATSPNAGGVLALVGTPKVSNGTFTQVGNTLTVTPTTGFVGAMVVRYVVGDGKAANANGTVTITVRAAADVAAPTITLNGTSPLTLTQGAAYTELGATWTDANDGSGADTTITGSVNTADIGIYTLTYSKTNAAGKVGSTTRTVLVVAKAPVPDTTAPVVTLNGASSVSLTVGGSYTEQGASWSDAVDGSGAVSDITGTVNTSVVGSYMLTYRKTDAAGNTGTATRTVSVNAAPDPMPTGAALVNVSTGDVAGGSPITPINAGGATDPLGRVITYTATGLPAGLGINGSTGVISGTYDAFGNQNFTVTVTATPTGGTHPLVRTFTLTILDQG